MRVQPVHRWVERWASLRPDALAVQDAYGCATYRQLDAAATDLAGRLRADGVGRQDAVALHLERSVDLLVATLAVFKVAATAVQLDPEWAPALLQRSLGAVRPVITLTATGIDGGEGGTVRRMAPRAAAPGAGVLRAPHAAGDPCSLDEIAWSVFTSGSTGRPKVVDVTHRALAHRAVTHRKAYRLGPANRSSWLTPPGSSIASVELWPVLAAGGSLHIPPAEVPASAEELRDWLIASEVDVAFLSMPVGAAVTALPWPQAPALRLILVGGDSVHRWPAPDLPFEVTVEYGCAEASAVTSCLVPPGRLTSRTVTRGERRERPPVGRPWPDVDAWILDERLQPVTEGEVGEVFVSGPELARGYRAEPGATAARFLPHPWRPGERLYRTGDLGRWDWNGRLQHLGRADRQIKVRGQRVEPAAVEAVLETHPAVRSAVVTGWRDPQGQTRLVAYVVARSAPPPPEDLVAHAASVLPTPAVPSLVVLLPALPLNAAGKVDRLSLPPPAWSLPPGGSPAGPDESGRDGDAIIGTVRALWRETLGAEPAGMDERFWESGGDSLLAARLLAGVRERLGVRVRLREFLREPTPGGLMRLSARAAAREQRR